MLKKQVILITGASKGIGYECAKYLKDEFIVIATAKTIEDVRRLKEEGFNSYLLDVTKQNTIDKTFEEVLNKYKKIDIVFNNAGYGQPGAIEDIKVEVLKEQFEVNVFGLHRVTLKALEIFKKQGFGKLIQHSSVLGLISLRFRGAYNASKYAVEGLSDTLRLELANEENIFVVLLNTGPIISNFRNKAKQMLVKNVDIRNSRFSEIYQKSLKKQKSDVPFTLPAIEVAKIVKKIALSPKPKPRYYITKATYLLGFAKRFLSTSLLDKILLRI